MANPLSQLISKIPQNVRSSFSMIFKAILTILAFYLLLAHKVEMVDHRTALLDSGTTVQISAGEPFRIGNLELILKNGKKALKNDGEEVKLTDGMHVKLADNQPAKLLPLEKKTTFAAIMDYLPRISASTFWSFVLLASLIKLIGILCSMYRWHLLLQGQGIRFPFWHLIGSFLIGRFLGTFLPSTIGLDGYKLYDATRFSKRAVESTAATVIEKVLGIVGIFITFLVALPFGISILGKKATQIALMTVPIAILVITGFFLLLFFPWIVQFFIHHLPIPGKNKIKGFINRVSKSAAAYRDKKLLLLNAAFQSFMVHFCTAAMYFFTALAIGAVGATFWQVTFASSIQIFATVISPITIAGEGIREIAQYYLLRNQLGPAESIVSAALGFWAAEALTLFGGFFWWLRKKTYRPAFLYLDGQPADLDKLMTSHDYGLEDLTKTDEALPEGWMKKAFFTRLWAGLSGGFLAGVLLGISEAFWIFLLKGSSMDIFPYSMVMYGLIGAAAGLGAGIGFGLLAIALGHLKGTINTFALVLAGWFAVNLLILGKFRLFRDVFKEQGIPMPFKLVLLAIGGLSFLLLFWLSRRNEPTGLKRINNAFIGSSVLIGLGMILWISSLLLAPTKADLPLKNAQDLENSPNVIMIMLDALRADHLGCYGYSKASTPVIDNFVEDSIRFHHAYSQSSWTKPGTATLFTGMFPSGHNTYLKPDILPDSITTLAEVFQQGGYYTIGFPNNINISPGFNFGQGFDQYTYLAPDYFFWASDSSSELSYYSILRLIRERFLFKSKFPQHYYQEARIVNDHAIKYFKTRGKKETFFMYLHYMEAHDPYFKHPFNGVGYARVDMPNPDPEWVEEFTTTYDHEITYLDSRLGELFEELKRLNLWDNTIILLVADHGEEFYDHDGWWHGTTLYQEQIRIPMIFKRPRQQNKGDVRLDNARQIDVAPTLLSLCKLPPAKNMTFGRNLFGPENVNNTEWPVFAEESLEGNVLSALIQGQWKYINANKDNPRRLAEHELYRIDIDPDESKNIARSSPDKLEILKTATIEFKKTAEQDAFKKEVKVIDKDELDRMKALGYVQE